MGGRIVIKDCYQIIMDEQKLKDFIVWLPDHSAEECYFYALFYRAKYSSESKKSNGGNLLFRGISSKESLFYKISQLECPTGSYVRRGEPVSQESLALYIHPNPRNLRIASLNTLSSLVDNIKRGQTTASPHKEALSCIQTSAENKPFIVFDIDNKEPEIMKRAIKIANNFCEIIETRGGYHLLIRTANIHLIVEKLWYKMLAELSDSVGDMASPAIGCSQGNFSMKQIPLKISTTRIKGSPLIALVSTIDRNVSVNIEKECSQNERVLKSAKAKLSANWREYLFGELICSIKEERRKLLSEMVLCGAFQQIDESFGRILKNFPEFIDAESIKSNSVGENF